MKSKNGKDIPANDPLLQNFAQYIKTRNIYKNPFISPHRFPGRGLGIRTNNSIPPRTKLMHVPTSAVLNWWAIPTDFMPAPPPPAQDGRTRVHARLAAYLAFGNQGDVEEKYGPWMKTWPVVEDFRAGMPRLWPEGCRGVYHPWKVGGIDKPLVNGAKKRKFSKLEHQNKGFAVLPPGITGKWATLGTESRALTAGGLLVPQQRKFEGDLAATAKFFPAINDRSSAEYQRFTWTWCCVNTRSFYYWRTWGKKPPLPPDDRDEAMAMCPGMDFFNHTADEEDGLCCTVSYDERGFTVLSPDVRVKEGEELFVSYGPHGEEDLWVEYGFMLGEERNRWDAVRIDTVVFGDGRMKRENRRRLKEAGYHGNYALGSDGVCWRTETAARLLVMEREQWESFVRRGCGDEHDEKEEEIVKQAVDEVVSGWIGKVQQEAGNSITGLQSMTIADMVTCFVDSGDSDEEELGKTAKVRLNMCLNRWRQVSKYCDCALTVNQKG
jgi:hypothetical protein